MNVKDIARLERALGTLIDRGAPADAVWAATAAVSRALRALPGADKRRALAGLALRGARELLLVPELLRCLDDEDRGVRHGAAVLLWSTAAEIGLGPFTAEAVEALLCALRDGDRRVRVSTVGALGALRYAGAEVVERVLEGLGRVEFDRGDRRAAAVLGRALRAVVAQHPAYEVPRAET